MEVILTVSQITVIGEKTNGCGVSVQRDRYSLRVAGQLDLDNVAPEAVMLRLKPQDYGLGPRHKPQANPRDLAQMPLWGSKTGEPRTRRQNG
ncbi:MAG: hypothetical protein IIA89_15510 [Chloroflexi bacterium]|nr:hypothetical protein [Chloroflexota bacterium]